MRSAVMIFYWVCAMFIFWMSMRAEIAVGHSTPKAHRGMPVERQAKPVQSARATAAKSTSAK